MIKRIILHLIATMLALYLASLALKGDFEVTGGLKGYLIAALIFGVLNGLVKPILKILSLPFVLLTAGLFIFVINSIMVWFTQYALGMLKFDGVSLVVAGGVLTYLLAGFVVSLFNLILHWLVS